MAPTIEDWRVELIQAHPTLFRPPVGAPEATQGYPMCSDGWRDLLERLFTRIKAAIAEGSGSLRVVEIKETYGIHTGCSLVATRLAVRRGAFLVADQRTRRSAKGRSRQGFLVWGEKVLQTGM